jgi:DNA-binding transcriptional LysR family regulator
LNVELKHLRSFVAVAEELNFTRAAERLFMTQQALSGQIRLLEERIGTKLLERDTRRVELTVAGRALLDSARPLIAGAELAVAAAREAGKSARTLTVGFVAAVTHAQLGHALEEFGEQNPDVNLLIHFGELVDPSGGLRSGEADVAAVHGPFENGDLELAYLWSDPLVIAMAADHPLAEKDELTLADVVAEPTFDFPTTDKTWHAYWMLTKHRGGRAPRIVAQFRSLDALVEAMRAGLGIHCTTPQFVESLGPGSGIVWREVPGLDPLEHSIAWRRGDDRPIVQEFVAACRAAFGHDVASL